MTSRPAPRHSVIVRVTHWVHAAAFFALVFSGVVILLAYPRLHWGETGTLGMPAFINLPLPLVLEGGFRGPMRGLHFLAAWVTLFNGCVYAISGLLSGHFSRDLVPQAAHLRASHLGQVAADHLALRRPTEEESRAYNVLQRLAYLAVIFLLYPFMFITGFAMSPGITSVFPFLVKMFGGFQSARTFHFFAANLLVLFLFVHVGMVILAGFIRRCRSMITGYPLPGGKLS